MVHTTSVQLDYAVFIDYGMFATWTPCVNRHDADVWLQGAIETGGVVSAVVLRKDDETIWSKVETYAQQTA